MDIISLFKELIINSKSKIIMSGFVFFVLAGCSKYQFAVNNSGNYDGAIINSIEHFCRFSKIKKMDDEYIPNVFNIGLDNYLLYIGQMSEEKASEIFYVSISPEYQPVYLYPRDSIGSHSKVIPSKYYICDGNLFFWNDSTMAINGQTLDALREYNMLDTTWIDRLYGSNILEEMGDDFISVLTPDYCIMESCPSDMYLVRKDNPSKFKIVKYRPWRKKSFFKRIFKCR